VREGQRVGVNEGQIKGERDKEREREINYFLRGEFVSRNNAYLSNKTTVNKTSFIDNKMV
jgi:hypothetical protein